MNFNSNDYKSMICARADHIRMALYPQYNQGPPQAIGNNYGNAVAPAHEVQPNFDLLRSLLTEIGELAEEFETSIGPA